MQQPGFPRRTVEALPMNNGSVSIRPSSLAPQRRYTVHGGVHKAPARGSDLAHAAAPSCWVV